MRVRFGLFALALVLVTLVPNLIEASPVIFTDRSLFEAFAGPLETETFEGEQVWTFDYYQDVCTRYLDALSISYDCHGIGGEDDVASLPGGYGIVMHFDTPRSAVGFDYDVTGFSYVGISSFDFLLTGSGFIGVVDDRNPIGTIGQYNPGVVIDPVTYEHRFTHMTMDNLIYTRVPEPNTMLLFGGALVLLAPFRYTRHGRRR
jgi:hypothetical protein